MRWLFLVVTLLAPPAFAQTAVPAPANDEADDDDAPAPDEAAEPPADAEPAASDMVDDLEAVQENQPPPPSPDAKPVVEGDTPVLPDVINTDPERNEVTEERKLERQAIRYDFLPPVERPVEDSRRGVEERAHPPLGLSVVERLGTGHLRREMLRLKRAEERAALDELLKSVYVAPRLVTGPLGPRLDIPLADNELVQRWITFFKGVGSKFYRKWVARYWRYGPVMRQILESEGVPSDTIFLSMIESGFSPKAYSFAHAAGPWQFIRATGTRMGLQVDFWVDERRDPIKSTFAAARYLKELFRTWNDWHLAWASYNAGPGKVNRAIKRQKTREFFSLARGRYLRSETKNYVPKLIAAAVIGQNPAAYGFGDVEPLPLFEFDTFPVSDSMSIGALSKACMVPVEELQELNPELRRPMTPPRGPGDPPYALRVPRGKLATCKDGMLALSDSEKVRYRRVRVKAGDSLASLATRFKTSPDAIVAENSLPNEKLKAGEDLIIPVPPGPPVEVGDMDDDVNEKRGRVVQAAQPRGTRAVRVVVQKGESLWEIAQRYGVDVRSVVAWNGLNRRRRVRIGQTLVVYVKDSKPAKTK